MLDPETKIIINVKVDLNKSKRKYILSNLVQKFCHNIRWQVNFHPQITFEKIVKEADEERTRSDFSCSFAAECDSWKHYIFNWHSCWGNCSQDLGQNKKVFYRENESKRWWEREIRTDRETERWRTERFRERDRWTDIPVESKREREIERESVFAFQF